MDLSPWLILRQASEAMVNGRPDDAHRLLAPLLDDGHRKAWRAAREVVKGYCARATRSLDQDQPDAAWWDLLAAESLNTGEKCIAELRQTLTRLGMIQARGSLEAGDPDAAAAAISRLRERGVNHPDLLRLEEAARDWLAAAGKADRGDFLPALDDLHRVRAKLPCPPTGLDRYRSEVTARHARFLDAFSRAQEAAAGRLWSDAVAAADDALSAAPEYHVARAFRTKAWQAAYPEQAKPQARASVAPLASTVDLDAFASPHDPPEVRPSPVARSSVPAASRDAANLRGVPGTLRSGRNDPVDAASGKAAGPLSSDRGTPRGTPLGPDRSPLPKRFLLWVDGVAGYLVCTGPRVTFGQAVLEGGPVDVPLFADVSRVHAELSRDGEGFIIEAGKAAPVNGKTSPRNVQVNGQDVTRSVLAPNDRVTLGTTCQFIFQKPVSVSATAKLEMTSGHRLMLPVEGVLLMANEVILSPSPQSHVVIGDAPGRVLLYRSKDGLGVRFAEGKFLVNDQPFVDRAPLPLPGSFEAGSLTFTVEPLGPRV